MIFEVGKPITLHVDGKADTVLTPDASHAFSGGTLTAVSGDTWRVAWNSGEVITVSEHGISLDWQVSAHDPGSVQGLLGPNSAPWSHLQLPDGTLMKLVKVGEIEFYSDIIRRLPQLPDFIPLCYGHGVLPARPGVDKAPRDFIVLQNVVGAM